MSQEIINHYGRTGYEDDRINVDTSRFEYERTKEIISRYLPNETATIVDIGGATGAYSFWLAGIGHKVHLIDLTPLHIDMARQKQEQGFPMLESLQVGDGRNLPFEDESADIVLLMGPLYHLTERKERAKSIRESLRIVKKRGRVICAAISRYASILDGFRSGLFNDPEYEKIADSDLATGVHKNTYNKNEYFTTAYFHKPDELRIEMISEGLICDGIIGVEGPLGITSELNQWLDKKDRFYDLALKYMRLLEREESLLGVSFHLLGIGIRP